MGSPAGLGRGGTRVMLVQGLALLLTISSLLCDFADSIKSLEPQFSHL